MTDEILDLAPRERQIRIAGEVFTLVEMTGRDLQRYVALVTRIATSINAALRKLVRPKNAAEIRQRVCALAKQKGGADEEWLRELYAAMTPGDLTQEGLEAALAEATEITQKGNTELFTEILGKDAAWCDEHLTTSMRNRILEVQNELNAMEEVAKNVAPLLAAVS